MSRRLACALAVAAVFLACGCKHEPQAGQAGQLDAGAAPAGAAEPPFQRFATTAEALQHILAKKPRIVGFGEFHQTTDSTPARSAMERFVDELDVVMKDASDLVVETWVEEGKCGKQEEVVSQDVRQVTQRPAVVENHLLRLLGGAKERGVAPHVMVLRCDDYAEVLVDAGQVDYEKMLGLIKRKLAETTSRVFRQRQGQDQSKAILIYSGSLHNDRHPHEGLAYMSFAADVAALVGDGYVEVDLYVPEYIQGNPLLIHEPWYPVFERHAAPDRVLVFEPSPGSYVVILPKGMRPAP